MRLTSRQGIPQLTRRLPSPSRLCQPPTGTLVKDVSGSHIDGFRNRDLRDLVARLLGMDEYTVGQMSYDFRRLRLKGIISRQPGKHKYFLTPYGWKVARLFSRLESRVLRPAMAVFTSNDAVLPFPLRTALNQVDRQMDRLIYEAIPALQGADKPADKSQNLSLS